MRITAGYGDPETWGAFTGHPNDPRYDEDAISPEERERRKEEDRLYQEDMDELFKDWK